MKTLGLASLPMLMNLIERFKPAAREAKFWIFFNVLGIAAYISINAWLFAPRIPEEAFDGGDQFCFWMTRQFPLLALYLGINLTWILMSKQSPLFKSQQLFIWLVGCAAWGILFLLDPIAVRIIYVIIATSFYWSHNL